LGGSPITRVRAQLHASERRACAALGQHRSTQNRPLPLYLSRAADRRPGSGLPTIRRDTAPNGAVPSKKANESNDGGETSAPNGELSGTEAAQTVAKAIAQQNKHERKKEERRERERALAAVSPRRPRLLLYCVYF
jgi:hypothetical protein